MHKKKIPFSLAFIIIVAIAVFVIGFTWKGTENVVPTSDPAEEGNMSGTEYGTKELAAIRAIIVDPKPTAQYLIDNRNASTTEDYEARYYRYILAMTYKTELDFASENTDGVPDDIKEQTVDNPVFRIDTMSVDSVTDLIQVINIKYSGAYNFFGNVYRVSFGSNTITVEPENFVYTTAVGVGPVDSDYPDEKASYTPQIVNGYFKDNKTFEVGGGRPFSLYPCNVYDIYTYYGDRMIRTSGTQAKDCKKYTIDEVGDIPDDFDGTQVEVYKVTPKQLQAAKALKI